MFAINRGKGFFIKFPNGLTLSTQFGGGNYCDNHDESIAMSKNIPEHVECKNAEIAIIDYSETEIKDLGTVRKQRLITDEVLGNGDEVKGYVDMCEWLDIFDKCRNYVKGDK